MPDAMDSVPLCNCYLPTVHRYRARAKAQSGIAEERKYSVERGEDQSSGVSSLVVPFGSMAS